MSKNLTRKGLAFSAIVALGTTLFAGAPAHAAGIDNGTVSLAPSAGAEYDIIAGAQFSLKSNFANSAKTTGAYLKFLVEDASAKTTAVSASSSRYTITAGAAGSAAWSVTGTGTATVVTVTTASAHSLKVGDKVTNSSFGVSAADANVNGSFTVDTVPTTTTFTYKPGSSVTATPANGAGTVSLNPSYGTTRGTGTSYVFDTKSDTNLADKTLVIASTDEDTTQTVTVTAWVDQNDNGAIDTTEYQSPARTVRFLKHGDVTSSVAWNPITVGTDSTVSAKVTFTPTLNGSQLIAANNRNGEINAVNVNFTRPGSSKTIAGATVAYSNTTKAWTVTSVDMNSTSETATDNTTGGWAITQPNATNLYLGSVKITSDVVTVTTAATGARTTPAAHELKVGDLITIASSTTARADITTATEVLSVPTTTTFTYAAAATGVDLAATAQTAGAITVTKILRNYAVAGDYTAQVLLYKDATVNALTKVGTAVSSSAVAVTASSAAITAVASTTVSATVSAASTIYTGTTSANFVATVKDADGAAVGAGIDAVITATTVTSAGTVKINGTTVVTGGTVVAKTDAKGQVAIALENSSALAGQSVVLDFTVQGVSAAQTTATWGGKVYRILDLADQTQAGTSRNRAVADGAAYTFNFLVQDQFKAPAGDDIRLVVATTGNTVSSNTVALTAGKASVDVADGGLTTGATTVSVNVQKLTAGVWAAITDADAIEWDGTGAAEDIATVAINYYSQTDAISLNADAANYPSSTVADLKATATAEALTALDLRVANGEAAKFVASDKGVVSGKVGNASTGAGKAGAEIKISGTGLLFKSGDVWSVGSATVLSNDGTFSVEVYSSAAGDKVVTIAVGAVTKTATVAFTGLGASKTNVLSAVGQATVQAGRAVDYTATVVDKLGNPVAGFALKATITGAGYFAGSQNADGSASVTTDVAGKAVVKVLYSANDAGTATVTFADNDASTATADNLKSVVINTEVGITDADVTVGGKAVYVSVEFAKGKTVTVTVDGKRIYSKLVTTDNYTELKFTQKNAGKHVVTVRISGGIVYSESVVTTK